LSKQLNITINTNLNVIQTSQLDVNSSFSFTGISKIGEKLIIIDKEPESVKKNCVNLKLIK